MSSEQTRPTLADYVALAISPALIIGLVGSLVFFLLEVLYAGQYPGRLRWILFFFVFGAVLVARVSMTTHIAGRAGLYGTVLGVLSWLGMQIFIDYKDTPVADVSWLINLALIGIVGWCANRLTWDCTHIEEESDAGSAGLLEEVGIEKGASQRPAPAAAEEQDLKPGLHEWLERLRRYRDERKKKKRALGVWVVWFSLAALPLFALGQSLIPVQDSGRRQYVFWLMTIYVGCGLGLLLSTCFLGLRRYLRQRKLRMPGRMTGAWLTLGGGLIVALLLLGVFLPRPTAEYPLFDYSPIGSEKGKASRFAVKGDNPAKGEGRPGNGSDPKAQSGSAPGKGGDKGGDQGQGKDGSVQGKEGSGQGRDQSSGRGQSNQSSSGQQQSGQGDKSGNQGDSSKGGDGGEKGKQGDAGSQRGDQASRGQPGQGDKQGSSSEKGSGEKGSKGSSQSSDRTSGSSQVASGLRELMHKASGVLKWVVFALVALLVVFFILKNLLQFLANFTGWARSLLEALRNLWASLFGQRTRTKKAAPQAEAGGPEAVPERPFSDFPNPFEDGSARTMTPRQLVRYTFAALQAWARERDLGRQSGETALEFVGRLCSEVPPLEDAVRALVMLYGRAVYARGALPASAVETVRQFWDRLEVVVERPLSA
jgi:hypothetical protein